MRIAVATSDQQNVDLHFGKTSVFHIYDVRPGATCLVKEAAVTQYCASDPGHSQHEERFSAIAGVLEGCRAVICVQIGDLPRMALAEAGIQAFTARGPLVEALHNAFLLLSAGREAAE